MRCSVFVASIAALIALAPTAASAKTFKWTSQGDITSLDPQAQSDSLNIAASLFVYDPLVRFDVHYKIIPWLASSWEQVDPETVVFKLRPGVTFHDGSAFGAEDVKFSIERAAAPTSQFKNFVSGINAVNVIDPLTVEIISDGPNPALLRQLTLLGIMSKTWADKHSAKLPQSYKDREETYSSRNTNGTGPFMLQSREIDVRTVYVENPDWWNKANKVGNVTKIIYVPISQNATRTAALLSGEVDFVLDPPAQDLKRIERQAKVLHGTENRSIFFGMDQTSPELKYSNIKGKNPLQDQRVRQALYQAINIDAIHKVVMRGDALPSGSMIAPQVNGYTPENAQRLPYDPVKAAALIKEAGYPNGFEITLDCPNNRYINDEAICQAVTAMWTKIGVKTTLSTMPRSTYFAKLQNRDSSIYLFGWGVPTFDALFNLQPLLHSPGSGANGAFNYGGYKNPQVDALIDQIKIEPDQQKRNALIAKAYAQQHADVAYIPLHIQIIPWAMQKNVHIPHRAENRIIGDWIRID